MLQIFSSFILHGILHSLLIRVMYALHEEQKVVY